MSEIEVIRHPQPYPCELKEKPTWNETVKTCSDYQKGKGLACVHWDLWDGCKLKRAVRSLLKNEVTMRLKRCYQLQGDHRSKCKGNEEE